MARPTTKRRLRDIDPDDFGRDVAERVEAHVTNLFGPIAQGTETVVEIAKESSLLAQYAKDGVTDPERATLALFEVRAWLYSCAAHASRASRPAFDKLNVSPDDDVGIVLLAANARLRLSRSEAVSVRELACLASVDPDHVRLLARQGQTAMISGGVVAPKIAKQWLTARGVVMPTS